jgi:transcriptional regulator with XRE-family HTH domain
VTDDEIEFYGEVGRRVVVHRTAGGFTQAELAAKTSLGRSSINNLEAGTQAVPLYKLDEVARALGISVSSLLPDAPMDEGRPLELRQLAVKARDALNDLLALFPNAIEGGES